MDVGPSAAPIIAIEAASLRSKPISRAIIRVKNIPNWAAAPNRNIFGFDNSGPKSIIAPMPINSSKGNNSVAIPALNSVSIAPMFTNGRLTIIAPKPIGSRSVGSMSFFIAR